MTERERQPHAVLDESSRILKARKIIRLLGENPFLQARNILEVGCGSGVIASTLAKLGTDGLSVDAVDVADNRLIKEGYHFTQVTDTRLPFDDNSFDIVISNHVIEHVGDEQAQLHHLGEISRVLRSDGACYLAVPNKWRLIEPHYRLPLLSWLSAGVADQYIRMMSKGSHYDCVPLSNADAIRLFEQADFRTRELTIDAIHATLEIEFGRRGAFLSRWLPRMPLHMIKPWISTLIYRLEKNRP